MKIVKKTFAGTFESSDVFVEVSPSDSGRTIKIESVVLEQFGDDIRQTVEDLLNSFNIDDISITLRDRGALKPTIEARVETALKRATKEV